MKTKIVLGIFGFAIFIAVLGEFVAWEKQLAPVVVPPQPTATTTQPAQKPPVSTSPQPATTTLPDASMHLFPFTSLDAQFIFNLYAPQSGVNCIYRVSDIEGHEVKLDKVVGTYNIRCAVDLQFKTDFMGWVNGDKFLLRGNPGDVKIVDVKNLTTETHHYDPGNYYVDAASRSLQYWLYQNDEGGGDYTILDQDKNIVLTGLKYGDAFYDAANDGFVFMGGNQVSSSTYSLRVDFLSVNNLKLKNILTTEPEPTTLHEHGCYSASLSSRPGEIILDTGCSYAPASYYSPDGKIHIAL
jgi:hypothetical protein